VRHRRPVIARTATFVGSDQPMIDTAFIDYLAWVSERAELPTTAAPPCDRSAKG
jgi:hypothetical protein